jgi:hypothetical protein
MSLSTAFLLCAVGGLDFSKFLMKERLIKSETVHADAIEVLGDFLYVLDAKCRLDRIQLKRVCSIAHVVKDVNRQFLLDLTLAQLIHKSRHLLRRLHTEFGKTHYAHEYPGHIAICSRDRVKKIPDHLCLKDFPTRDFHLLPSHFR